MNHRCVGIDATKGGWMAACMEADITTVQTFRTIDETCDEYAHADCVLIDIPIGLSESKLDMRPDGELRRWLIGKSSSVFNVPCRQAVYADSYRDANAANIEILGKGLSRQSHSICAKIREVDIFLKRNPSWQNRLMESHPEIGFAMMNAGRPVLEGKKTWEGTNARISLLKGYVNNMDQIIESATHDVRLKNRMDDVLDALCLAVISNLGMTKGFATIPEVPGSDKRGLKMQIVIATIRG